MNKNSKGIVSVFVLILLALVVVGGIGYYAYKNGQIRLTPRNEEASTTTPTPIENSKAFILGNLEFKLPTSYYTKYTKNQWYPIEAYDIDPDKDFNSSEKVTVFLLRLDKENTKLQEKADALVKTWRLLDVDNKLTTIAGIKGTVLTGRVNPENNYNSRFPNNAKVKIAIFIKDNEVYHLLGDITDSNNEKVFDQIFSTFKFLDKTSAEPTPKLATTLAYTLLSGWQTVQDNTHTFEISFDPNTQTGDPNTDLAFPNAVAVTYKNLSNYPYYSPYASSTYFFLKDYNGGSRHTFLQTEMFNEPLSQHNQGESFQEKEYLIQGKNCLVLYGLIDMSQGHTTIGMCPLSLTQALVFTTFANADKLEPILKTLKFL